MNSKRFIDKLIYRKDKENTETYLKGKFFVYSTLLFFLLCFSAIPYYAVIKPDEIDKHPEFFFTNLVMLALVLGLVGVYRKFGKRVILVHILTFFGWIGNYGTFETTGGIFSPDNMWGIIIASWVFLVADKKSGFFWFGVIFLTITFFYYAELKGMREFYLMTKELTSSYYYFNYIMAIIFLLLIIYLHESSKEKFLKEIVDAKIELEEKSKELEIRNKDVTDSINYAKKIQYAVLPHEETIYRNIPLSFIYYKPKDIVSGDFFWFHEIDKDNYILVCADCTGHGVPGAFMTVIGSNLLNLIVIDNKIYEPARILKELDKHINFTLKQQKEGSLSVQDGMDLSLLKVNKAAKEFIITSAKRPVVFIRNREIQEFKGSKFSLGGMRSGEKSFEEIKMTYAEDDTLYFFTDGYHDQFGGEKGKKFSTKRLKEHLMNVHKLPIIEQKEQLQSIMDKWKGGLEQVDDMLVMGIKF